MLLLSPVHVPLKQCFLVTVPQFSIEIPAAAGKMARVMGAKPRNRWLFVQHFHVQLTQVGMVLEWFWMGFRHLRNPGSNQP